MDEAASEFSVTNLEMIKVRPTNMQSMLHLSLLLEPTYFLHMQSKVRVHKCRGLLGMATTTTAWCPSLRTLPESAS